MVRVNCAVDSTQPVRIECSNCSTKSGTKGFGGMEHVERTWFVPDHQRRLPCFAEWLKACLAGH